MNSPRTNRLMTEKEFQEIIEGIKLHPQDEALLRQKFGLPHNKTILEGLPESFKEYALTTTLKKLDYSAMSSEKGR